MTGISLPIFPIYLVSAERGIFMRIQMDFEAGCLEFILKHNLSEKIRPYISLGEVLLCMANHPEMLDTEGPEYLWTGGREVGVVLQMNRKGDYIHVRVYDIVITRDD